MFPHFFFNSIQTTRLFNEVIDDFRGLFVCQLIFTDTSIREKLLQVRVQIVGIKARVWIPSDMCDVFKPTGSSDICLGEPGSLLLALLVFFTNFTKGSWCRHGNSRRSVT